MKTYIITFGDGDDSVQMTEQTTMGIQNLLKFLSNTGWEIEEITNIKINK